MPAYILDFSHISLSSLPQVGGKNASLGEMYQRLSAEGIQVPSGFAVTTEAYWHFIEANNLKGRLQAVIDTLDTVHFSNLQLVGKQARELILSGIIPKDLASEIVKHYHSLCQSYTEEIQVAVRSSATAEDLPTASFAGQHESYLNIRGEEKLLETCLACYASLFTDRAIKYRNHHQFDHMKVALSIGIQKMVRSDIASSGVVFTIDPESGFEKVILITGAWGLGENVVQGAVNPDEFYVFKPTLQQGKKAIIRKKIGSKDKTMVYAGTNESATLNLDTPLEKREQYVLTDEEIQKLAGWALRIEEHYGKAMDIEWAKDGVDGEIYIVQARPETIHGQQEKILVLEEYRLTQKGKLLTRGKGIGNKIISGYARVLMSPKEINALQAGEILVTDITNPDWDPIMKKASAIITNRGGRTSHAAIVARELGAIAVVGTGNATECIKSGDLVTVCCTDTNNGLVYAGALSFDKKEIDLSGIYMPETKPMFIIGDPDQAFKLAQYPNAGVGLMRLEFIINSSIKVHPMALVKFNELQDQVVKEEIELLTHHFKDKQEYFIENLAQAVATIAAAFYPKEVIVRMSDFKTNEYANLVGGKGFEPHEENPMLGFRGASRYYSPQYKEGFGLECKAMKRVRDDMGLTNVKLMIPFCRTVEEGRQVIDIMRSFGLTQGENNLEIYVMTEIPSNVILAREFARVFDGFSIGSNDLTQLTLGIDRDSSTVSDLFNERDEATRRLIVMAIEAAKETGKKIGFCGQAPSDLPDYAEFLVEHHIDSISFNPDALIRGITNICAAEQKLAARTVPAAT
jgi:pyruvate, water dikinase